MKPGDVARLCHENPASLRLFKGLCCRGESQSRHGSAVGQNQSIRSFACTLMPIVAQAQRNSSVVS